jgi:hypothetical protein
LSPLQGSRGHVGVSSLFPCAMVSGTMLSPQSPALFLIMSLVWRDGLVAPQGRLGASEAASQRRPAVSEAVRVRN